MMKSNGSITISTTVSRELYDKAHNKISWSEALRIGLTYLISKMDDTSEYRNPLQLERKIEELSTKITEIATEKTELQEELNKLKSHT